MDTTVDELQSQVDQVRRREKAARAREELEAEGEVEQQAELPGGDRADEIGKGAGHVHPRGLGPGTVSAPRSPKWAGRAATQAERGRSWSLSWSVHTAAALSWKTINKKTESQ